MWDLLRLRWASPSHCPKSLKNWVPVPQTHLCGGGTERHGSTTWDLPKPQILHFLGLLEAYKRLFGFLHLFLCCFPVISSLMRKKRDPTGKDRQVKISSPKPLKSHPPLFFFVPFRSFTYRTYRKVWYTSIFLYLQKTIGNLSICRLTMSWMKLFDWEPMSRGIESGRNNLSGTLFFGQVVWQLNEICQAVTNN